MSRLMAFAKAVGTPGSIGFLAVGSAFGLLLAALGGRPRRAGRTWLLVLFAAYVIAGLPIVAHRIAGRLPGDWPPANLANFKGAELLVVLSGDNARGRAREARRVFDAIQPECVIVSGRTWFADLIIEAGVPPIQITVDSTGATTKDQIDRLPIWMTGCRAAIPVVVASRLQMARIAALTRARRLPVLLAPSPIDDEPASSGLRLGIPSYLGLRVTRDALYEHAALRYYRSRQWIP